MNDDVDIASILDKTTVFIEKASILMDKDVTNSSVVFSTTLWVFVGVIIASLITREIKISEFRQAWINDLREDISEYISKVDEWIDIYLESSTAKKNNSVKDLNKLKYDSIKILRRIKMRFKPDDGNANDLISNLNNLLDPSETCVQMSKDDWVGHAENVVNEARHILKEEWDVTKNPLKKIWLAIKKNSKLNKG